MHDYLLLAYSGTSRASLTITYSNWLAVHDAAEIDLINADELDPSEAAEVADVVRNLDLRDQATRDELLRVLHMAAGSEQGLTVLPAA